MGILSASSVRVGSPAPACGAALHPRAGIFALAFLRWHLCEKTARRGKVCGTFLHEMGTFIALGPRRQGRRLRVDAFRGQLPAGRRNPVGAWFVALLAVAFAFSVPTGARAELPQADWKTRAAARKLGVDGLQLMRRESWKEALDKLERAYQLYPVPTLGVATARCLAEIGRLVEAAERYREVGAMKLSRSDGFSQNQAVKTAQEERAVLLPRIPNLAVIIRGDRGDDIEVFVDGEPLPAELVDALYPVDPGAHEVRVRRPDVTITESAEVEEGETARVIVKLPNLPLPPPPPVEEEPPDWRTWMWVGFGVGGGGALMAIVGGASALQIRGTLRDRCGPERSCPPSAHDVVDGYDAARYVTTIGMVLAGAGAAAGTVFYVLDAEGDDGEGPDVALGPGAIRLHF
ncbi:MAG: hypothetical protein AAF715_07270 [Myxococcota bacterium]